MQSPFNFPMALVQRPNEDAPAKMTVQTRPSTSRRGGYKVAIGFQEGENFAPVNVIRLDMN